MGLIVTVVLGLVIGFGLVFVVESIRVSSASACTAPASRAAALSIAALYGFRAMEFVVLNYSPQIPGFVAAVLDVSFLPVFAAAPVFARKVVATL